MSCPRPISNGMKLQLFFAVLLSFVALFLWQATVPAQQPTAPVVHTTPQAVQVQEGDEAVVARVVDGDTIELTDGTRVRYIGIDTPEVYPTRDCYGNEASDKNTELVLGKTVRLVADVSNTDKYDRLLRYVYLQDGTFVNEALVRMGYAHARSYPPDVAQQETLREAERLAREEHLGLWDSCN